MGEDGFPQGCDRVCVSVIFCGGFFDGLALDGRGFFYGTTDYIDGVESGLGEGVLTSEFLIR